MGSDTSMFDDQEFDGPRLRRPSENSFVGYDADGYDVDGYDADGFDSEGKDRNGNFGEGDEGMTNGVRLLLESLYVPDVCCICHEELSESWKEISRDYCADCLRPANRELNWKLNGKLP